MPPKKKLPTGPARSDLSPSTNWRSQLKQAATDPFRLPAESDLDPEILAAAPEGVAPDPEPAAPEDPHPLASGEDFQNLTATQPSPEPFPVPQSSPVPQPPEDPETAPQKLDPSAVQGSGLHLSAEAKANLDQWVQETGLPAELLMAALLKTWAGWPDGIRQQVIRQAHALQVEQLLQAQAQTLANLETLLAALDIKVEQN